MLYGNIESRNVTWSQVPHWCLRWSDFHMQPAFTALTQCFSAPSTDLSCTSVPTFQRLQRCVDLGLEFETIACFLPWYVTMYKASSPASSPRRLPAESQCQLLWRMSPALFQVLPPRVPKAHTTQATNVRPSQLPSNLGEINLSSCTQMIQKQSKT